jgi:putative oxidoreductase
MTRWLNRFQPYGLLLLRLALALSMIFYGYEKVIPHGALTRHAHYVTTLGMPYWLGYISAFTEFAGGILVLLGLFTRLASALIAINMLVALFTVGIHEGFATYSNIISLTVIAIMLVLGGPGKPALDRKLGLS